MIAQAKKLIPLTQRIVKEYKPEKIILFGSYAWGKPTADSDVDFFIIKKTKLSALKRIEQVSRLFPQRNLAMDFLVYTPSEVKKKIKQERNLFIEDIVNNGVVLYEAH